jgi:hypothetical protein
MSTELAVGSPWRAMPIPELVQLMHGAPFFWCLAGGHAVSRAVGRQYRPHQPLFKSKDPRAVDEVDFRTALPVLTPQERASLTAWLRTTQHAGHPWLSVLAPRLLLGGMCWVI